MVLGQNTGLLIEFESTGCNFKTWAILFASHCLIEVGDAPCFAVLSVQNGTAMRICLSPSKETYLAAVISHNVKQCTPTVKVSIEVLSSPEERHIKMAWLLVFSTKSIGIYSFSKKYININNIL